VTPVIVVKGESIIRRFECPFCGWVHIFSPKGESRFKKRVVGFTCPGCGKKPTEDDFNKVKGGGSKPKEERRKRVKKEVVKETPTIETSQPYIEEIQWKTSEPPPPGGHQNRGYGTGRVGWNPKPPQPMNRTFGEAVLSGMNIRPSAPIPSSYSVDLELEELERLREERKALEGVREDLEKQDKRLAIRIVDLERVEKRVEEKVKELDIRLTELDSKLQALSTLTSHMEMILDVAERKRVLIR